MRRSDYSGRRSRYKPEVSGMADHEDNGSGQYLIEEKPAKPDAKLGLVILLYVGNVDFRSG